jgi:cell division septal protein FtsQ
MQVDHRVRAFCRSRAARAQPGAGASSAAAPDTLQTVLRRVLYWLAVLLVALALLVAVVLLLAARDSSSIGVVSLANTTIRLDAL